MNFLLLAETNGWVGSGWFFGGLAVGLIAGFFISRAVFIKQMKKNPPINENMIRAMFMQMGRKPSEAQIKAVMNSMNAHR